MGITARVRRRSEKVRKNVPILDLPRHDYAKWVTKIIEVAAMKDSDSDAGRWVI
ncbi:hypothetical protein OnM2_042082 [Erysiphe neolycopersici]|uniref:Uncharacterized protein n=1 Tax=Erysiphe neolycopersici TaxID=212602 RepID=A0A420HVB7_9PEZI|nr:hypothetical protein OnM2_042082 [Erysiphe neolycopersici]